MEPGCERDSIESRSKLCCYFSFYSCSSLCLLSQVLKTFPGAKISMNGSTLALFLRNV